MLRLLHNFYLNLIVILLSITSVAFASDIETKLREAREKSYAKDYQEAINIYDSILDKAPKNIEAINGKARVLSWMGQYDEARTYYQKVLVLDSRNLSAYTGMSDTYAWQKNYGKALELMADIIEDYPDNREVILRLARYNLWKRDKERAIFYSDKLLDKNESDGAAREIKNQASTIYSIEYFAGYSHLNISTTDDGNDVFAGIRYEPDAGYSLYGQVDYLNRFNESDTRLLGGVYLNLMKDLDVELEMSVTPDADVYARYTGLAEFSSPVLSPLVLFTRFNMSNYPEVEVYGISVAGEYYTFWNLALLIRYTHSRVEFDGGSDTSDSSLLFKLTKYITADNRIFVYYSEGDESFRNSTIDLIGDIDAKVFGAGGTFFISPVVGLSPRFEYQDREGGTEYLELGLEIKYRM